MNSLTDPIVRVWQWWFTPRSTDPTVMYRERALRNFVPVLILLRAFAIHRAYSGSPELPTPFAPFWIALIFFILPILFTFYFLIRQKVDWAGASFLLHWYLTDMINLPADGYWYAGFQLSLILQTLLAVFFLPSPAILPFMLFQFMTVGLWGNWLDVNYFDPPLLSTGQPVATFRRTIIGLFAQESIFLILIRYLRIQMEKSLRLQQSTIGQLAGEIEERRLLQREREVFVQELEQRNAELERLAYTLSHELKSPLITIRGFLGYMREDALRGNIPRIERDMHRITEGSDKMLRLINELIDLMSVGRVAHAFKEFSLQALADESVELVRERVTQKNIAIHITDNLPVVYGDRKRLLEVFQNLLENSAKFMGEQSEPKIEIGQIVQKDSAPVFYVRDNGIGIDPRFNERVFRIFEKLDVNSEGTGIGLALVKRIIEVHGGRVWVESDGLSKGSTFCFTIPDNRKQKD